jgi:hypothetical protein
MAMASAEKRQGGSLRPRNLSVPSYRLGTVVAQRRACASACQVRESNCLGCQGVGA